MIEAVEKIKKEISSRMETLKYRIENEPGDELFKAALNGKFLALTQINSWIDNNILVENEETPEEVVAEEAPVNEN
jgi:hypothetical protein